MASVEKVSIYQEARYRVEKGISDIIQCLNERKNILFREIAVLENECKTKQHQKLNSLKKLESLMSHTEEQLGDNLLTEIQDRVTQEIQKGIHEMNQEIHSTTADYSIQMDWTDKLDDVKESIKGFHIVKVPKSSHSQNAPATNAEKKTRQYSREVSDWPPRRYEHDRNCVETNREDSPILEIREDDPIFEIREDSPILEIREDSPIFEIREDDPIFEIREDSPIFEIREDSPILEIREDSPIFKNRD